MKCYFCPNGIRGCHQPRERQAIQIHLQVARAETDSRCIFEYRKESRPGVGLRVPLDDDYCHLVKPTPLDEQELKVPPGAFSRG